MGYMRLRKNGMKCEARKENNVKCTNAYSERYFTAAQRRNSSIFTQPPFRFLLDDLFPTTSPS